MRRLHLFLLIAFITFSGCVQKMGTDGHQLAYVSPGVQPSGTVALGQLKSPLDNPKLEKNPLTLNRVLLARGRERFGFYCAPCHGDTGYGDGMIVQRGFPAPPSYHSDRLRQVPDGYIFGVIGQGFGRMYGYGDRVNVEDRWAIVAYVRALQLSQNTQSASLSPDERARLEKEAQ